MKYIKITFFFYFLLIIAKKCNIIFDLNETLNVSTNVSLDQKQQFMVNDLKTKKIKTDLSENLSSLNVETTIPQEKEYIFETKERKEVKAKPNFESLKQLNIQLVNTLEVADKLSKEKVIDQKVDKQLIQENAIQTIEIVSNTKEQTFKSKPVKFDKSQVDFIQFHSVCASEISSNDREQNLKQFESKVEKLGFEIEGNRNLNVQECLVLQNDKRFDEDFKATINKANLEMQLNKSIQSSEVIVNEKENEKDFNKKYKEKRLQPSITTKEAVIIKQVESKDSSVDLKEGKLELEQIKPVIDIMEPLEVMKPDFIESLKKHKKTVTISEQADFTFLENLNLEVGLVKSASNTEPFILEKKYSETKGELNLSDKKAIQKHQSLIFEKEGQFKPDKKLVSNASKDLQIDNALIVSQNEKIDTSLPFEKVKVKKSKASRDLSESRLKLIEIKDLQIKDSLKDLKQQELTKEKAILNLNENLSVQVSKDNYLENESKLNLPKPKRKSIKDKKVLIKSRSLSVERNIILNKEKIFNIPEIYSAKAQHELISSPNLIEQRQQELLQSVEDFKSKPLKFMNASVSLNNLHSLQIDQNNIAESEQNLVIKPLETTKILPLNVCGVLKSAESLSILAGYNLKPKGKFCNNNHYFL